MQLTGHLLLGAALAMLASLAASRRFPRLWLVLVLAGAGAALGAAGRVLAGGTEVDWRAGLAICGEPVHLRLDALSAVFLALLGVTGGCVACYAGGYWPDAAHPRSAAAGRLWLSALFLGVAWVLLAANGLHFLVGWEVFALSGYFLITLDRHRPGVRTAGWLYLAASHAGTLCLFAFFALLAARTGSWDLGPLRDHPGLAPLFWLALVGFGVKAGLFPLHIWLPSAHASAPSHVSALLSGMALKVGIYGLVRFSGWLPVPPAAGWVVAGLGVVSAVLGVAFALGQHDLKRLLAYHSVENIGIILLGLGFALVAAAHGHPLWGQLALAGALLHVWNHGLFKSLLFLGAGSVLHATGAKEMSRLGGLWRAMPWTAGLFALGAAAISGLPPLNGFISEWLIFLGLFDATVARGPAALGAMPAVVLLALTGALALACFTKVCGVVFLGAPRSPAARRAHEGGPWMRAPMVVLAAACAGIGLAPAAFWPALLRAVAVWNPAWRAGAPPPSLTALGTANVALAVFAVAAAVFLWRLTLGRGAHRAPTWDCGYAAPTARMQYTAGSFASIITDWFAWIMHPLRHVHPVDGPFPARAAFAEHTPETVLERVVQPVGGWVLQTALAARRLQHGRLQTYLIYLVAGLAAVAVLVLFGGRP